MKEKAIAALLGSVLAFGLLEVSIRAIAHRELGSRRDAPAGSVFDPEKLDRKNRILILGNSFTMGVGAPPRQSYPDRLQEILDRKAPGQYAVFNRGAPSATTRYLLEQLEENLRTFRPTLVIVMSGQANFFNHYGYEEYLRERGRARLLGSLYPWVHRLSVFRLAETMFHELRLRTTDEVRSLVHLEGEWDHSASAPCSPQRVQALETLHDLHPDWRRVCDLLAACSFQAGNADAALSWVEKSLAIDPGQFHYSSYRSLVLWKPDPRLASRHEDLLKKARSTHPGERNLACIEELLHVQGPPISSEKCRMPATHDWRALKSMATEAEPSYLDSYFHPSGPRSSPAQEVERRKRGLASSLFPFQYRPREFQTKRLYLAKQLRAAATESRDPALIADVETFLQGFRRRYPHLEFSVTPLEDDEILSWVLSDLKKISARLRELRIPLLLQTYPPRRHEERPWDADSPIRALATEENIPLSDTYEELTRDFLRSGRKDDYYPDATGDEHLNARGYARVAEILYGSLVESRVMSK
ncbi:MAG TPA: GDSL-type esterase/lipase family protein [Bdellovibrionota bacterium]|nr:GDSL-type esterase/lipase family protein [Bdellovibrionota bacterium]